MKDINFLDNEAVLTEVEVKKKHVSMNNIIGIILVLSVGVGLLFTPKLYSSSLEHQLTVIQQEIDHPKFNELTKVKNELTALNNKINVKKSIINHIDARGALASQALLIIENALPSGCFLTSVKFNEVSVSINARAENSIIASEFISNLDRLKLFTKTAISLDMESTDAPIEFSVSYDVGNGV